MILDNSGKRKKMEQILKKKKKKKENSYHVFGGKGWEAETVFSTRQRDNLERTVPQEK